MTQADLARIIGTSPNQISMIESGQSGPSVRTVAGAARALGVATDFLTGLIEEPVTVRQLQEELNDKDAYILELERERPFTTKFDGTAYVEVTDIRAAADASTAAHRGQVKRVMQFPRSWLRNHGLEPRHSRVIAMVGEAMEPTLDNGCPLLVDLKVRSRESDRVYVIATDEEATVRRVVNDPKAGWLVVSDNPDKNRYPSARWPEEAAIIAEVKWHGESAGERDRNPGQAGE